MSIIDFSTDISDAQPPAPLPPGQYPAEIIGAQQKTSTTSGSPYISVLFRIHPQNYPADYTEGDPDGIVLQYNRLTADDSPRSRYAWRRFLEGIGASRGRSVDLNSLLGATATVDIIHQEYPVGSGEMRAQINRIMPA